MTTTRTYRRWLRSGLLELKVLCELQLFGRFHSEVLADFPEVGGRRLVFEITRRMLSLQIHDVIATTQWALADQEPADANHVRRLPVVVGFGSALAAEVAEVKYLSHKCTVIRALGDHGGAAKSSRLLAAYLDEPGLRRRDAA